MKKPATGRLLQNEKTRAVYNAKGKAATRRLLQNGKTRGCTREDEEAGHRPAATKQEDARVCTTRRERRP